MAAEEEPPDGPGLRPRWGCWIAVGLLALLLVGLMVLAVLGWMPWWPVGGAGGLALVVLWATGRLHQGLRRPRLRELAGATLVAGLVVLWVKAPDLYTTRDAEKSAVATANTRAGILTLGAAIAAGLVAWVSLTETQRANREADQRDRYAKAIEQLGSGKPDVRLGGIYGLERIVKTSKQDHPVVVEVLGAYVRQHTDLTRRRGRAPVDGRPEQGPASASGRRPSRRHRARPPPQPTQGTPR